MNEYISFDKMITPVIIKILFWLLLVITVLFGLYTMFTLSFLHGLFMVLLGPVFLRIYCEIMLVIFKINDNLSAIRKSKGV